MKELQHRVKESLGKSLRKECKNLPERSQAWYRMQHHITSQFLEKAKLSSSYERNGVVAMLEIESNNLFIERQEQLRAEMVLNLAR